MRTIKELEAKNKVLDFPSLKGKVVEMIDDFWNNKISRIAPKEVRTLNNERVIFMTEKDKEELKFKLKNQKEQDKK